VSQCGTSRGAGVILSAAQGLQDPDFVTRIQRAADVPDSRAVDKDEHVGADAILLVDHAEADARESPVEPPENLVNARSFHFNIPASFGIGI
jgi:hypothetical protein